jgi:ankyrin repeat protein
LETYIKKFKNYTELNIVLNKPLNNGRTLLYTACKEGKTDIVKYLLQLDINQRTQNYIGDEVEDCLGVASRWNYIKVVELLLKKGNYSDKEIFEAVKKTSSKAVKKILKNYKNKTPISLCCF